MGPASIPVYDNIRFQIFCWSSAMLCLQQWHYENAHFDQGCIYYIMHFYYASNSEIIKVQIYEACESLNIIVAIKNIFIMLEHLLF